MNAFLFPGQGSQEVGMGKDIYDTLPAARRILETADNILGYSLKEIMFNGPPELLTDTQYAQPAIFTCSAMHLEKARNDGTEYCCVAGHSLGEYSALYAAGVLSFEDGLSLVEKRGKVMAAQNGKGTMAAVLGLTEKELIQYLNDSVVMANLNSKTQIVISGSNEGIDMVEKRLKDVIDSEGIGFRRLTVSAAFHSPQMLNAEKEMELEIEKVGMHSPTCWVVSNVTGKPTMNLTEIKSNLIHQITGQVRWYDSIMRISDLGIDCYYEVGNGEVLRKLNRTIMLRPKCLTI